MKKHYHFSESKPTESLYHFLPLMKYFSFLVFISFDRFGKTVKYSKIFFADKFFSHAQSKFHANPHEKHISNLKYRVYTLLLFRWSSKQN